ncbi:MAG TPA: hypothetical protein VIN40_03875 [Candidatus Tyrphobacter sp.]
MYIQPYQLPEFGAGTSSTSGYGAPGEAGMLPEMPFESDGVRSTLPWTQDVPGLTDGAGSLQDAPFGSLGIGGMLSSLTGMMQQLVQIMQSLLGRMGNGGIPGERFGGCTQPPPTMPGQRYPLDASPTTFIEE